MWSHGMKALCSGRGGRSAQGCMSFLRLSGLLKHIYVSLIWTLLCKPFMTFCLFSEPAFVWWVYPFEAAPLQLH
jgi:hypothetical protein